MSVKASELISSLAYEIVRKKVGLFDLSDVGVFKISGSHAETFLNRLCGADISYQKEEKTINTVFCNEKGEIVFIGWILKEEESFSLHVDSEKREFAKKWISQQKKAEKNSDLEISDLSEEKACLSLVGPLAQKIMLTLFGEDILGLPYLGIEKNTKVLATESLVCRYGYTGEYEYRLFFEKERKSDFIDLIESVGANDGLGKPDRKILDLLMLEMKSINQNIDLSPTMTPLQAGLHWMLNFRKDQFIGKEALVRQKEEGTYSKLVMLLSSEDSVFEPGAKIFLDDSTSIGTLIHPSYSPTLKQSIALGLIVADYAWPGIPVNIQDKDKKSCQFNTVSAPVFITQSILSARD